MTIEYYSILTILLLTGYVERSFLLLFLINWQQPTGNFYRFLGISVASAYREQLENIFELIDRSADIMTCIPNMKTKCISVMVHIKLLTALKFIFEVKYDMYLKTKRILIKMQMAVQGHVSKATTQNERTNKKTN